MSKRLLLQQVFCLHYNNFDYFSSFVAAILIATVTTTAITTAMETAMNLFLVVTIHVTMLAMTTVLHIHAPAALLPVLVGIVDQVSIGHVMVIPGLLGLIFTQDQDICSNFTTLDESF